MSYFISSLFIQFLSLVSRDFCIMCKVNVFAFSCIMEDVKHVARQR